MDNDFVVSSPAFEPEGIIPAKFTVDGENISPPLKISGAPADTASLALIMDDPDAATDPDGPGHTFVHWVVANIAAGTTEFPENDLPPGAIALSNSTGGIGYIGPAPPNGVHRYFFKLYALSGPVTIDHTATAEDLLNKIEPLMIAKTELVGKYQRSKQTTS